MWWGKGLIIFISGNVARGSFHFRPCWSHWSRNRTLSNADSEVEHIWKVTNRSFNLSIGTDSVSFKDPLRIMEMKGISLYLMNPQTIHFSCWELFRESKTSFYKWRKWGENGMDSNSSWQFSLKSGGIFRSLTQGLLRETRVLFLWSLRVFSIWNKLMSFVVNSPNRKATLCNPYAHPLAWHGCWKNSQNTSGVIPVQMDTATSCLACRHSAAFLKLLPSASHPCPFSFIKSQV